VGFVDLHSHILFAVDDGAPDLATSRQLISGLASVGFTEICATPHQKSGQYLPSAAQIQQSFLAVAPHAGAVTLHLGAENMWDDVFFQRWQDKTIPTYGQSAAFLVEFRPDALPVGIAEHLFRMRAAGQVPVLAHPERYQALWDNPALVEQLRAVCAFVVDLGAVAGAHGRRESKAARFLLEEGLAHAAASDAHQIGDVKLAADGIAWIRRRLGDAAVARLLSEVPRQLLAGKFPE
jgi:protein-tyrosine phosphatase